MISNSQKAALLWLKNRNGDAVFDKHHVLTAAGERAPVMRSTWNKLEIGGYVERYDKRRLRITDIGKSVNLNGIEESQ